MIQLPNGCKCGELSVIPKNWNQASASVKINWYIHYRFYDPMYKEKHPKGLLRRVKGMNDYKTLEARRSETKRIIKEELDILKNGFNPHTGEYYHPDGVISEISPTTPFSKALNAALEKFDTSKNNKYDITSCLNFVIPAIEQLKLGHLEIGKVSRKHIYAILDQCKKNKKETWSNQTYNHYRAYLRMLFKVLRKLEAIEANPVTEVETKEITRKIKVTLSDAQRIQIHEYLKEKDPDFLRFIHIFFVSGARMSELFRVKGEGVELNNQRFKIMVLKGKGGPREEWRPIRDIALDLWKEQMENCGPEDYLFSQGCKPYKNPVLKGFITKKWREQIKWPKEKGGLGINVDFYALKHLNLDETAALISEQQEGIKAASAAAGHTGTVITMKYAQGEKDRQNERLKKLTNKFA